MSEFGKLIPTGQATMLPPNNVSSEAVAPIAKPVALNSIAGVSMAVPNAIAAKPVSEFTPSAPNDLTPEAGFNMAVPNAIGNVAAGAVTAPITLAAETASAMTIPVNLTAETADTVVAPVARASVPQTAFPSPEL